MLFEEKSTLSEISASDAAHDLIRMSGKRIMPIRQLRADSDANTMARAMVQAHPNLLDPHLVSLRQVERLLRRLIEYHSMPTGKALPGVGGTERPRSPRPSGTLQDASERDLNKVSDHELQAAKHAMARDFDRHALRPGDDGYVHDKRVAPPAAHELESNDWDAEIEDVELENDPSLKELLAELEARNSI